MKNHKLLDKDFMEMLRRELTEYEQTIGDLTPEERKELRKWVKAGNSVHENPYLMSGEDGGPLDYISAIRIDEDMWNNPDDYRCGRTDENDRSLDDIPF